MIDTAYLRLTGRILLAVWLLALAAPETLADDDYLWVEGEAAVKHSMKRHGWYDSVRKNQLSGGEWLSHFASGSSPVAEYELEIPKSGAYSWWIRCNTSAKARLSYRLDGGSWKEADLSQSVQRVNIASDGKPDLRFVAWVDAGDLHLEKGGHRLSFRFDSSNEKHGGIDCFLLTRGAFRPRGLLKPGERTGRAENGHFAWEPPVDSFGSEALVDLSDLNEDVAGHKGRVRSKGEAFELGDGRPVRFWAANAGPGIWSLDRDAQRYLARRLAKCGVNMVRLHGSIYRSDDPRVIEKRLDGIHRLVAALRQEGIYSSLSFYFPLWFRMDGKRTFMLVFFDEELQRHYYGWVEKLLETRNPYTGTSLAKDPAVAIVELINEDSHFFWTFGKKNTTRERWKKLQRLYAGWLTEKYGSLNAAYRAWDGDEQPGDAPDEGRIDLFDAWAMTTDGVSKRPQHRARTADQVRFLTENMRGFYTATIDRIRTEHGYGGLISCGNWHVSDARMLDALERYCYTAGDVIDYHGYFDPKHEGDASSYSIRKGHEFRSQSALFLKRGSPIPFVGTAGYPQIVSEIGWPNPNAYRAEEPFLTAAYGALQGIDGIFHFAIGGESWDGQMEKFAMNDPETLGSFPAAALIFRRGDIREGPIVAYEGIDLKKLYSLEGSRLHREGSLEALRATGLRDSGGERGTSPGFAPLSFYVGRVVRDYANSSRADVADAGAKIDHDSKTIESATGELHWDYGRGFVTLSTPRACGAAGFLGRLEETIDLGSVRIRFENDYGTIYVVSLDGEPLESSERILIQAMTISRPHGFETSTGDDRHGRITELGSMPWGVEKIRARVQLKKAPGEKLRVVACDEHGYPTKREVETRRRKDSSIIRLDPSSVYHVVLR